MEHDHPAYYTYEDMTAGIPLARYGWDDDDLCSIHDFRPVYLLLFALSEATYEDHDYRTGVLGELDGLLPEALLDRIPVHGIPQTRLRASLGAGPFAALADFAAWISRETGLEHLDTCHEEGIETAWTRPNCCGCGMMAPRRRPAGTVGALVEWLRRMGGHAVTLRRAGDRRARRRATPTRMAAWPRPCARTCPHRT
ncbi:MAG: hypothetical protein WKG00_42115 [Polyangiaceae bacterium]